MALAAHRRASNIKRTVQVLIGNTVTTAAGTTYNVIHNLPWKDPDAVRDDNGTPMRAWVATTWISDGAGRRGASLLQADVYVRVKGEGAAGADPQGLEADAIADALVTIFSGSQPDGRDRWQFDVQDFTDPASPVSTGECMLCLNSRGDGGEPESVDSQPPSAGFRRVILRWRFVLLQDTAGPAAFYTA